MLETESAATLPPEQLRLILLRWKFFFFSGCCFGKVLISQFFKDAGAYAALFSSFFTFSINISGKAISLQMGLNRTG